ncbi:MAG: molybdate ABC transporter substrate-binding protein, partial [Pseudomonadales bacterium]
AMSQLLDRNVIDKGSAWVIPRELYDPIRQDAIVIMNNRAVAEFIDFVKGEKGQEIITSFGYEVEPAR